MHHQDSSAEQSSPSLIALEELRAELSVLAFVAKDNPISEDEVVRALARDPEKFGDYDPLRRAVGELIRLGLLRRQGELIWPTRAVRRLAAMGAFDVG
jgi:hypothetical protein